MTVAAMHNFNDLMHNTQIQTKTTILKCNLTIYFTSGFFFATLLLLSYIENRKVKLVSGYVRKCKGEGGGGGEKIYHLLKQKQNETQVSSTQKATEIVVFNKIVKTSSTTKTKN